MARKKQTRKQHIGKGRKTSIAQHSQIPQMLQQAIRYHQAGQLEQAETIYHNILKIQPKEANALNFLGVIAYQRKNYDAAVELISKAIKINSSILGFHNNLGNVFKELKRFDEAIKSYQRALALDRNFPEIHYNLAIAFKALGKNDSAIQCYEKAIQLKPDYADSHNNLGLIFQEQGKFLSATTCYQRALVSNPKHANAHYNLGNVFREQGKWNEAVENYQKALTLNPNDIKIINNLGVAFEEQDKFAEAIECYERVMTINPNYADAYGNLANIFKIKGMIDESIEYAKKALTIEPAVKCHSNFVYTLNFSMNYDRAAIFKEHQKFNEQHCLPLARLIQPHRNERNPDKRLKIGYISPDFRKHSVAYLTEPVFANHNHAQFEIFFYYTHTKIDAVTQHLQKFADRWVNCYGLSDEALAEKIRRDKIDILVDLSGHMAHNRLLVFARKPAPIQVTYLGYPNTTGLTAIDYHITDNYVDPEGIGEQFNSEQLIRMPHSYYVYNPIEDSPDINTLPALENNYIRFCSFNSYSKFNTKTLSLWAEVLQAVPHSKFIVKTKALNDVERRLHFEQQMKHLGIETERLELGYIATANQVFEHYNRMDIALDAFPFNGATTTCQALWMGVPVVTLVGETHVARAGLALLSTVGLTELIAYTSKEYVEICVKLVSDLNYLNKIRMTMRERLLASPLIDGKSFATQLESHYRTIWQKWCNQG